jgi:hypothetical protein
LYQTTAGGMGRPRARLQRAVTENGSVFTDAELRYLSDFRLGRIATVGRDGAGDRQALVISRGSVSRMLFPEGSRNAASIP